MKFNEFDQQMRIYETVNDHCVLPGVWMVARLDGRSFTKLTRETHQFEAPFDVRFRDMMLCTVEHLIGECGFRVVYGYTQSDEISLLFDLKETAFNRKTRKYNSVLAGEASACFSLKLQAHAVFDCRICELPSIATVVEYFQWRAADAHRNALNGHCYWMLRKQGDSVTEATGKMNKLPVSAKNEMLFQAGINFNDVPFWQRRGIGAWWDYQSKPGFNPVTQEEITTERRVLRWTVEQPEMTSDSYGYFLYGLTQS